MVSYCVKKGFYLFMGYQEMMKTSEFLLICSVRVLGARLLEPLGSGALKHSLLTLIQSSPSCFSLFSLIICKKYYLPHTIMMVMR